MLLVKCFKWFKKFKSGNFDVRNEEMRIAMDRRQCSVFGGNREVSPSGLHGNKASLSLQGPALYLGVSSLTGLRTSSDQGQAGNGIKKVKDEKKVIFANIRGKGEDRSKKELREIAERIVEDIRKEMRGWLEREIREIKKEVYNGMEREVKRLKEEWAEQMEEADIKVNGVTEKYREMEIKVQQLEREVRENTGSSRRDESARKKAKEQRGKGKEIKVGLGRVRVEEVWKGWIEIGKEEERNKANAGEVEKNNNVGNKYIHIRRKERRNGKIKGNKFRRKREKGKGHTSKRERERSILFWNCAGI
ncbi:hypothetical protein ALC57_10647 [Trachymyrmex cornetzi]|uniref:Uncharacterized protein n=1 Tax=Trachymyrmex cornetzi TaxID=471704 RepID=A0A151J3R5_9HYME|nr:hypothetical protein ALC57_10647 [Trachymyrmex cornetzi]